MDSSADQQQSLVFKHKVSEEDDEQLFMQALHLAKLSVLPVVLKAAIELDLLEIIAKSNEPLSASDISSQLPAEISRVSIFVERILLFLVSNSILKCITVTDEDGKSHRRFYSAAPICKYLTKNEDGVSLAPYLVLLQDKVVLDCWRYFKDAVLEGITPWNKVYGWHLFEYKDQANTVLNETMNINTSLIMQRVVEEYDGFEDLKEVVDVGGGFGASLLRLGPACCGK